MRKILILGLICLLALIACKGGKNPYSPEPIIPEPPEPADVQVGSLKIHYYSNADPSFNIPPYPTEVEFGVSGTLTNTGELSAENIRIHQRIYGDSWSILWESEDLFINPSSDTSCLAPDERCEFSASWQGLDITIFWEVDEDGRAIGYGKWDSTATRANGTRLTWE